MRKYLGALISLILVAAASIGILATISTLAKAEPRMSALSNGNTTTAQGTLKAVSLTLQTFPFDPYNDPAWIAANVTGKTDEGFPFPTAMGDNGAWVKYWPTTELQVPAHALVTISIQNYDSATPLLNPFYARPQGVVNNTISVDGAPTTQVDPANTSHTFTIHSIPSDKQPWLYVSVPVTGVDAAAKVDDAGMPFKPVVTTFSFVTGGPGKYIWQCFDPCGSNYNGFGGPMSTKGYMSGTLTVV